MVLGLCLEAGSASAHSVILARAMGIPVVAGLGPGISALADGTMVAVDGEQGTVWISPDADQVAALEGRRREWLAARRAAELERHRPAATRDGRRIRVFANISGVAEAAEAVACGAEGVGVLRTEFLFLGRAAAPGEEEQLAAYRAIAESLGGRPLTVRALDIGGDKSLPYVEIGEEANPFLGWRGIRVLLSRRDLFRTQLRAILRAGAAQPVELLLPMIASLDELRADQSHGWRSGGRAGTRRVAFPEEHPDRRHDRSARGGGRRRSVGARGQLLQHRQQRSHPVRHGRRPRRTPAWRRSPIPFSPPYCA